MICPNYQKLFFEDQFRDWNYKLDNGESANEVCERMYNGIMDVLSEHPNKQIAIVSHGTAISTLLSKWCDVVLNEDTKLIEIYFNKKLVFDGDWKCPELFKLEFDDNNMLISINNIR